MFFIYSVVLVGESSLVIDCFLPDFFRQLCRAVDFSSSRDLFVFIVQLTVMIADI
jgi:hypothetical protein